MKANEVFSMAKADRKKMFYLIVLAIIAMILFVLSGTTGQKEDADNEATSETVSASAKSDMMAETEEQLETILGKIEGVGSVNVAIEWKGDTEKDYAYNEETSERKDDSESGSEETTTRKEMVLLDGDTSPVVIGEVLPEIVGVSVVAEGAYQADIRESLSEVVSTYLGIGANRIEITAMEAGS